VAPMRDRLLRRLTKLILKFGSLDSLRWWDHGTMKAGVAQGFSFMLSQLDFCDLRSIFITTTHWKKLVFLHAWIVLKIAPELLR